MYQVPPSQYSRSWGSVRQLPVGTDTTKIAVSWFVVGTGCNKKIGGLGSTKTINKTGYIYRFLTLQKALFRGFRDLVPVPSTSRSGLKETPRHLGGQLRTYTGHGTSELVAINVRARQKRKNGQNGGCGGCMAKAGGRQTRTMGASKADFANLCQVPHRGFRVPKF